MAGNIFEISYISYRNIQFNKTEQLGSDKPAEEGITNFTDGLSLEELKEIDANQDGLVTEKEYNNAVNTGYLPVIEAQLKAQNLTEEEYNKAMEDVKSQITNNWKNSVLSFLNKIDNENEDETVNFISNGKYLNKSTVQSSFNEYFGLDKDFKLNITDFQNLLKNNFDINTDDAGRVFNKLVYTFGSDTIDAAGLAAFLAVSDISIDSFNRGGGLEYADGSFAKTDVKDAARFLLNTNGDYVSNRINNLRDYIKEMWDIGGSEGTRSPEEKEKINDAKADVQNAKTQKANELRDVNKHINALKSERDDIINTFRKLMAESSDENNIKMFKEFIKQTREEYQEKIDELEKDRNGTTVENEINILLQNYKLAEAKKKNFQPDLDGLKKDLEDIGLKNILDKYQGKDISSIDASILENEISALEDDAKNLMQQEKYQSITSYISSLINTCIEELRKEINSRFEYNEAELYESYNEVKTAALNKISQNAANMVQYGADLLTADADREKSIKIMTKLIASKSSDAAAEGVDWTELSNRLTQIVDKEMKDDNEAQTAALKEIETLINDILRKLGELAETDSVKALKDALNDVITKKDKYEEVEAAAKADKTINYNEVLSANQEYKDLMRAAHDIYIDALYNTSDGIYIIKEGISEMIDKKKEEIGSLSDELKKKEVSQTVSQSKSQIASE